MIIKPGLHEVECAIAVVIVLENNCVGERELL